MRFYRLMTLFLLWAGMIIEKIDPTTYIESGVVGIALGLFGLWVFQPKNG